MLRKNLLVALSLLLLANVVACNGGGSIGGSRSLKNQISEGRTVLFGSYSKSGLTSNAKSPIEWVVIEKDGLKALLLSKYNLDVKPYNIETIDITWENCSIRKWLNNDFYNYAFNNDEKKYIIETNVVNNDNIVDGIKGGNNTKDKIFLLSVEEVNKYLIDGLFLTEAIGNSVGWWWLRSPGGLQSGAAAVGNSGRLLRVGYPAGIEGDIRPAVWVNINSIVK